MTSHAGPAPVQMEIPRAGGPMSPIQESSTSGRFNFDRPLHKRQQFFTLLRAFAAKKLSWRSEHGPRFNQIQLWPESLRMTRMFGQFRAISPPRPFLRGFVARA